MQSDRGPHPKPNPGSLRRLWILVCLVLAAPALSGGIYRAECPRCGYTQNELWHGRGIEDPFARYAVYTAVKWGMVVSVRFDLSFEFGELIGYDFQPIRRSVKVWEVLEDYWEEYRAFFDAWEAPHVLDADNWPRGAVIDSERPETRVIPTLRRLDGVWEEDTVFTCPSCGAETLIFLEVGLWD